MNLYFAACDISCKEIWNFEIPKKILLSYHYPGELNKTLDYLKKNDLCKDVHFLLDSGAFSAWNKGVTIDINRYRDKIKYIQDNYQFKEFHPVNLDVIPGKQGDKITKELAEDSMKRGWDNYLWFKNQGIETIHVFHQGEDYNFLLNTIIKECKYIGVSPSNDAHLNSKIEWCKKTFDLLPADIKSHGFAVTSVDLIKPFPWYSVDSASWKLGANMGRVSMQLGNFYFSYVSPEENFEGIELRKYGEAEIIKEIESYGIKFKYPNEKIHELKSDYRIRRLINYCYYKTLEQKYKKEENVKYTNPQLSLF